MNSSLTVILGPNVIFEQRNSAAFVFHGGDNLLIKIELIIDYQLLNI